MSDLRKAAEMALKDWLANDEGVVRFGMELKPEWVSTVSHGFLSGYEEALRQALAQPEQEPVGYVTIETISSWAKVPSIKWFKKPTEGPLYTAPPKREWVGLTDEEEAYVLKSIQKLKEKNT